jgi:hypothetical protein
VFFRASFGEGGVPRPQAAPLPDFFSAPYLVGLVPRHILGELAE